MALYSRSSGNIDPTEYTPGTAYYQLAQGVRAFFQRPSQQQHELLGTEVRKVPMTDPREALRGQAALYTTKDFHGWEVNFRGRSNLWTSLRPPFHSMRPLAHP